MAKIPLTAARIKDAVCPPDRSELLLHDAVVSGLSVRVYKSGRKSFLIQYRHGSGRSAPQRRLDIGDVSIGLDAARKAAKKRLGEIAGGADPSGERKRERARLEPALDAYESDMERRHVVKRGEVMSLLRRELLKPLGNADLAGLARSDLVKRIEVVEKGGRPGAAKELKTRTGVFLSWCVDRGLIAASPLAGWRKPRRTRAQRLDQPGRALADSELPHLWNAADATGWPLGPYLQALLLLGQRRTETAHMRWLDLDLRAGVWCIPAEITKSGRAHRVPLPPQAVAIIESCPRLRRNVYVFAGRDRKPLSGYSKRLAKLRRDHSELAGLAPWTMHDLRRTMRTGLGRLGVDRVIAELLLNHAVSDELARIYDRAEYWTQRTEAAGRWADHVAGAIEADRDNVVQIKA